MYPTAAVQENVATLKRRGHRIVEPAVGPTACGDEGKGRLAAVESILDAIGIAWRENEGLPDLAGKRLLITSGPTREFADPVRCVTNPSTGRMGVALARAAVRAGARVILVTGPSEVPPPDGLEGLERVVSAEDMRDAVLRRLADRDAAIFAAAVSDWKPAERQAEKAKKEDGPAEVLLRLVRTPDVAMAAASARRPGQILVGFAAETENLVANARDKMRRKGFDFVVANPVAEEGSGFGSDTNRAVLVFPDRELPLERLSKDALAREILVALARSLGCESHTHS